MNETIIQQWIDQRSTIALQKMLNHEPLTFEDNVVFGLLGNREELQRLEKRMDERFKRVEERFERVDERFKRMEERIDERFERVDERFKQMDERFKQMENRMNERFERVDEQFEQMEDRMNERFKRVDEQFEQTEDRMNERFKGINERFARIEDEIIDIKITQRDIIMKLNDHDRRFDDIRKEINGQTRWLMSAILAIPVLLKLLDYLLGKL